MRFSAASVALLAGAVAAVPQYSIQPISQISDGQIQAPPATSAVSMPSVVSPSMSASVEVPSSAASVSVVVPTATPIVPGVSMVTPIVTAPGGGNATVPAATGSASVSGSSASESASASETATTGSSSSSTSSASVPEASGSGAAAGNMVSFGGLVLAIGAAVFA